MKTYTTEKRYKILIIGAMVISITLLHLSFSHDSARSHVVARELYFLPVILSGFWFGLRGGLLTSLAVTAFYLPYSLFHWQGLTADDLDRILEIILFTVVGVTVGILQDRQRARAREKIEALRAMAGSVAHEMNSPLFVAMGTLELLKDDFDRESEPYLELQHTLKNLKELKTLIRKISRIDRYTPMDYDGSSVILDLSGSGPAEPAALQGTRGTG
ncbi:hypothetical protein GF1_11090 [Desulfolithobacter dissulfuricans]|uniref:histidine kinase n=1 Tax=Desulfolithobacter dissulfuricans TaxID=2795293 RepID=A0A915TZN8_9BACT|nr:DUF4118 domain-containing protein [Desulfolithobacter dissulfuricans]BCO08733.1 hypothetical protein GF1_11090 [Desulfolithobacter dissulfuricans]